MSTTTTITLRCDRCGHERVLADDGAREGWGRVAAIGVGVEVRIGVAEETHDDLCPPCLLSLIEWRRDPAAHPAPAPRSPQPVPKPRLNRDDRQRAIALVADGLRHRVGFALDVLRAEPTAILSGTVVPGTLYAIEDSAEGLVDGVLDRVGFEGYRRAPEAWQAHVIALGAARSSDAQ